MERFLNEWKSMFLLFLYFLGALIAISILPRLDNLLNFRYSSPGYISTSGVTIVMIFLMWLVLKTGIKSKVGLNKQFLIYTLLFTSLIVLVKFTYSPVSLYYLNQIKPFDPALTNTDPISMIFASSGIAALYLIGFWLTYLVAKDKYHKDVGDKKVFRLSGSKIFIRLLIIAPLAIFLYLFPIWIFPALFSLTYLQYVFGSVMGFFIALSLVGAIYFARSSFLTLEEQAVKVRDATLLNSFLWFGSLLIIGYHALWVVFMLVLGNIWPFKTYSSK